MKLINHSYVLPYLAGEKQNRGLYSALESAAQLSFERGKKELTKIISEKSRSETTNENEKKVVVFECLLVGVLWICHAEKAMASRESSLSDLKHLIKVAKSKTSSDILRKSYYSFRNHQLTIDISGKAYPLDLSLESFNKFMKWLNATEEYNYELKVIDDWYKYWLKAGKSQFLFDMNAILRYALAFEDICNKELSGFFNKEYFETEVHNISKAREDYFQVTKPISEYYLNGIGAVWMNNLNKQAFDAHKNKLVMAPGCMRPKNGTDCKASREGEYLRCNKCNTSCNINKLVHKGKEDDFDVLIALHQSTFKAEKSQLSGKGIVGIACMSCLIPGGLMLYEKGIHAQCSILSQPGCKKHWTSSGEMTGINLNELNVVLENYAPSSCK